MAWVCLCILALLPFHAFLTTWAGSNFGHIDLFRIWKEVLIFFLAIGTIWILVTDKKLKKTVFQSKFTGLLVIYLLITLLRSIAGINNGDVNFEALVYGLIVNIRYLVFFAVTFIVAKKSIILYKYWPHVVLGPAFVITAFGLMQRFLLPSDFLTHFGYGEPNVQALHTVDNKQSYIRIQSTLRGPNPLGAYLIFVTTAIFGLWARLKQKTSLAVLAGATFAVMLAMFFSYSRSAWLGLLASLLTHSWIIFSDKKTRKYILAVAAVLIITFLGMLFVFRNNDYVQNTIFHSDETSRSVTSSNEKRADGLLDGVKDVVNNPLGQGPGSAGPASTRNDKPAKISENYFIQIAQEVGLAGMLILVTINLFVATELYKRRAETLSLVLFASLIGITIVNLVSHAWTDDTLSLLWWGLAGIALARPVLLNSNKKSHPLRDKSGVQN